MATRYVLDSNIFIHAFRDRGWNERLQLFRTAYAPFEYLSAVVVQELRAGARTATAARSLQRNLFHPFERRRRLITPSYRGWKIAGEALAHLGATQGLDLASMSKSLVNDALIASSCREAGAVLITRSMRDFERLQRVIPFRVEPPWPTM
ncbi:MAG: type II toxin-antitoxin system VapC family toxin [Gemmatimonadaceae bacterium]